MSETTNRKCALPASGPCYYRKPDNECGNPARCLHAPEPPFRDTFALECVAANSERLADLCARALAERQPDWLTHRLAELRRECAAFAGEIVNHTHGIETVRT